MAVGLIGERDSWAVVGNYKLVWIDLIRVAKGEIVERRFYVALNIIHQRVASNSLLLFNYF